jgi:recombination protein RecA
MEVKFEKSDMTKAKQLRKGIRMIVKFLSSNDITYLISNHTIATMDQWNPKTTPGGKAIPFQCAVRIELDTSKKLFDSDDQPIGVLSRIQIVKNKVSIPFRKCVIQVDFDKGLNRFFGLLDLLVTLEIVKQGGAWYSYNEEKFQAKDFDKIYERILVDITSKKTTAIEPKKIAEK